MGGKQYKIHLDGYNQLEYITGKSDTSARKKFAYFNDDAQMVGYRFKDWKVVIREQSAVGGFKVSSDLFITYRIAKLFNLRMDPYERADLASDQYYDWLVKNDFVIAQVVFHGIEFLKSFIKYPPSQLPATYLA